MSAYLFDGCGECVIAEVCGMCVFWICGCVGERRGVWVRVLRCLGVCVVCRCVWCLLGVDVVCGCGYSV